MNHYSFCGFLCGVYCILVTYGLHSKNRRNSHMGGERKPREGKTWGGGVRDDITKNGAWAWAKLRERFGRDTGSTSFTEVFQYKRPSEKPFENVWRDWHDMASKSLRTI